jgi:hypothetical protein
LPSCVGTFVTESRVLSVLVAATCAGCAQALALADEMVEGNPDLTVRVIDVDDPSWKPVPGFAGTPMFYLDDRVVSYGNPTLTQLREALKEKAA